MRRRYLLLATLAGACTPDGGTPVAPPLGDELPRPAVELLVERLSRSGARTFYTMAPDGSRVAPFPGIPADAVAVSPSPDGRTLALLRPAEGYVHLWLMDRDGRNLRPLLDGARQVHSVAWSPDGQRLAYTESTAVTSDDLWVVNRDGTGARDLTPDPLPAIVTDSTPTWSPDGSRIAFSSDRSGGTRLWIIDADGRNPRLVLPADLPAAERTPSWSPDGLIAFVSDSPAGRHIGVVAPDGSGYRTFPADRYARWPSWSPDGRLLHSGGETGNLEIYALDAGSGERTNLTRHLAHDARATPLRHVGPGAWHGLGAPERYPAGAAGALAIAAGDLVADGLADLVVLGPAAPELRLAAGLAGGGFEAALGLGAGPDPRDLAVADVSRDGVQDAIVLGPQALQVFRGGPAGPGAPTEHPLTGEGRGLAVFDLDDDGSADVAVIHSRGGEAFHVAVFSSRSFDGELVDTLDYAVSFAGAGRACAGDVTGEGAGDLLVLTSVPAASAVLLPGHGDITFAEPVVAATGLGADAETVPLCADLDGDRRADLVLLQPGVAPGVSVLRSTGTALAGPVLLAASGTGIAAADFDRDGDVDLIVVGSSPASAWFLRNLGDGRFAAPVAFPLGGRPARAVAADLDGDLWPDLAVADADGSVVVLRNLGASAP